MSNVLDHAARAMIARATGGLTPAGLGAMWSDWAMHLALSPGKQMRLCDEVHYHQQLEHGFRRPACRFEDLLPRMFRSTNDLPDYYVVVSGIPCPMHDAEPEASVESRRSEIDDLRVQVPLLRRAANQIDIWRQRFCMRRKHSP